MIDLSDELLMAYVDGQLDKPQSAVVTRLLRDDPDLAVRVSRLQQTQAQLLDTFGALLREGASARPRSKKSKHSGVAAFFADATWLTASTVITLLLIGACFGVTTAYFAGMMNRPAKEVAQLPPTNWPGDIAEFHSFFTAGAMRVSPESQSNPDMVNFQLSRGFDGLSVPSFAEQGLNLVRGQMLSYRGQKVMQLSYLGKNQPLVSLYISDGDAAMPMSPGRFGDIKTISWGDNERRFVLAANMPHQPLQALAVIAKSQLTKN